MVDLWFLGNVLMVNWMLDGVCMKVLCVQRTVHHSSSKVITEGRFCTFQAVIKQVGSTSMAMMCVLRSRGFS